MPASHAIRLAPETAQVLAFPRACPTAGRLAAAQQLTERQRFDLDRLRWLAMRAQLRPKPDFEAACYVLAGDPAASLERTTTAFFRGLCDNASSEMAIYRPGARTASDDELWLLRLIESWRSGEERLAAALVSWRVRPQARRWMRFLSARIATALEETV